MLAPIPFREVFVILALFLPQLTFLEGTKAQQSLWASPAVKRHGVQVEITPTAAGLEGMHEHHVSFPTWSTVAAFCPAPMQQLSFEHLIERPSAEVHIGCQVGPPCPPEQRRCVCSAGCTAGFCHKPGESRTAMGRISYMTEFEGKAVLDHGMLLSCHSQEISRLFHLAGNRHCCLWLLGWTPLGVN